MKKLLTIFAIFISIGASAQTVGIKIATPIIKNNPGDNTITGYADLLNGGFHITTTTAGRDSLSAQFSTTLETGMLCFVIANSTYYQWNGSSWVVAVFGGNTIYTGDGTIPTSTNRTVTIGTGSTLLFNNSVGTSIEIDPGEIDLYANSNEDGYLQLYQHTFDILGARHNGSNFSEIFGDSTRLLIQHQYSSGSKIKSILLDSTANSGIKINDDDKVGFIYISHPNNTGSGTSPQQIPDRAYVDSVATGGLTFNNGLTNTSGVVTLGGALTQNTDIDITGFNFIARDFLVQTGMQLLPTSGAASIFAPDGVGATYRADLSSTGAIFGRTGSGGINQSLTVTPSTIVITDAVNSKGLVAAANYDPNFTSLNYITKHYADATYAPISSGVSSFNSRTGAVVPVAGDYASLTETLTNKNLTSGTNTFPTFNQNTTGTASNITATSNSTLTTLSALSLPFSQITGVPSYSHALTATAVKTSSYTAAVNDLVLTDATSGNIPITLPTAPTNGSLIWVKQTLGSNLTTITTGGSDVFNTPGGLTSISLIGTNQGVQLQYNSGIWYSTASNLPIALLDLRYSPLAGSTSVTTLGTIGTGTWQGTLINPTYGGTGVNNGSFTSTLAGNFSTSGAFPLTLTQTASTNVTLPITGTLATLAGTETFTNKTFTSPQLNTPLLNTTSTVGYVWTSTNTAGAGSWQAASSGFANPMTTAGDLILGGSGGTPTRLGIGSNTFVLTSNGTTAAWAAASGGTTFANPTASLGLTAINGSATTAMRSDAAPALDQTIIPTWTGLHTFQKNSLGVTAADAVIINTTTAAANNAQQESPSEHFQGLGWGTTAGTSQSVDARIYLLPIQGTVPTSQLNIDFANSGGSYTNRISFSSNGGLTTTGNIAGNAGNFTNTVNALKAGIGTTSTDGFLANNTNAATSGTPVQIAPRLRYSGTVWNTSGTPAKNQFDWIIEPRAVSSGTPTTTMYFASSIVTGTTPSFTDRVSLDNSGNLNLLTGNLTLSTAGSKINITTGSNASAGTATLASGTVTISTTAVTTSSLIFVVYNTPSGTLASGLSAPVGSITGGTSFVINSLTTAGVVNTLDNSTVRWWFIN